MVLINSIFAVLAIRCNSFFSTPEVMLRDMIKQLFLLCQQQLFYLF